MIIRSVMPQLAVTDIARAERWYSDVLQMRRGFAHASFAALQHSAGELFLSREPDRGWTAPTYCLCVDDAEREHALLRERGARIVEPLGPTAWGTREFAVLDPDGNRLRIGHRTR